MKTHIDIITLFQKDLNYIEHIKTFISNGIYVGKTIEILDANNFEISKSAAIYIIENVSSSDKLYLKDLVEIYRPERIIILNRGSDNVTNLLDLCENHDLKKICVINKVILIIDCDEFSHLIQDDESSIDEKIDAYDTVILSNSSAYSKDEQASMHAAIHSMNGHVKCFKSAARENTDAFILRALKTKRWSKMDIALLSFAAIGLFYLADLIFQLSGISPPKIDFSKLQNVVIIFLSILYEAFPFILIGILVSSFIQVLIPSSVLERIFTKNRVVGYLAALFAGVIFPVCDCATVPVVARLIKKGVPVPIAITFFLAAPIVNPIVIASTIYAFPGHPSVAVFRVVSGLLVALIAGNVFHILLPKDTSIITNELDVHECDCGHCANEHHHEKEKTSRFQQVLKHAAEEFFDVGIYLIIGALISSVIQTYMPKSIMTNLGGSTVLSILSMMLAAFILSICSTSDAFIARTFANSLPIASVMGFLVLGPMIDLKNLFLLMGSFKKRFVLKLVLTVIIVAFFILLIVTRLLFKWWL